MNNLTIEDMMNLQMELWEKHKQKWSPMTPEFGRNSLLWMFEEMGEVVAIIKKKGEDKIMNDPTVRDHFVEECSDVMMYFIDMLLRFDITPEEISNAYLKKSDTNKSRDYNKEYTEK